jgi:hypothetical protein
VVVYDNRKVDQRSNKYFEKNNNKYVDKNNVINNNNKFITPTSSHHSRTLSDMIDSYDSGIISGNNQNNMNNYIQPQQKQQNYQAPMNPYKKTNSMK